VELWFKGKKKRTYRMLGPQNTLTLGSLYSLLFTVYYSLYRSSFCCSTKKKPLHLKIVCNHRYHPHQKCGHTRPKAIHSTVNDTSSDQSCRTASKIEQYYLVGEMKGSIRRVHMNISE